MTTNPLAAAIAAGTIPPRPQVTDKPILGEIAQRMGEIWHSHDR